MKHHLPRTVLLFAATIVLLNSPAAWAQAPGELVYSESQARLTQKFTPGGRLSEVSLKAMAVEGTTKKELECGYPAGTILEVEGSLTVTSGAYRVEFKDQGQASLVLEAENGSILEGKGRATVSPQGKLIYELTARQAQNVVMNLKISPPEAGDAAASDAVGYQPGTHGDREVKYSPGSKTALRQSPKVTLNYENAEVSEVLQDLARQIGKKINTTSVEGQVTVQLHEATVLEVLEQILAGQLLDSLIQVDGDEVKIMSLAPAYMRNSNIGNTSPYKSIERTNVGF